MVRVHWVAHQGSDERPQAPEYLGHETSPTRAYARNAGQIVQNDGWTSHLAHTNSEGHYPAREKSDHAWKRTAAGDRYRLPDPPPRHELFRPGNKGKPWPNKVPRSECSAPRCRARCQRSGQPD